MSTGLDKIRKFYRGPLTDASCQISLHLEKRFNRKQLFLFQPIRNKNCPWPPYLVKDQDEMRKLYIGPLIDASYYISVQLAKQFQRTRFFSTLANQKQESPIAAMFVDGPGRNEQTL